MSRTKTKEPGSVRSQDDSPPDQSIWDFINTQSIQISRHRLYAAGEPLGESTTRIEGCRLIVGGGGSGGGGSSYYTSLNQLYNEQAASARLLRGIAEENLPGVTNAYMSEVNEVVSPDYADRQSKLAAADMASANAMERSATNRELQSMGVNPNDARFVGASRATEVNNAARMAAGKNIARSDANKYQLAVAQDAVGTFTGQSNSAASQASSASSGLQSLVNSKNASDQAAANQTASNTANAVGGAMALYSMFKDGGKVAKPSAGYGLKRVERHMLGGTAGGQQKTQQGFFQMPTTPMPPQQPQQPQSSPMQSGVQTYKNIRNIADTGKDIYDKATLGVPREQAPAPVTEATPTPVQQAGTEKASEIATDKAAEAAAEKGAEIAADATADAAGSAAADAAATSVADSALTTAATEAGTAAATEAAGAAVTEAGGSALMSGLGAAGTAISTAMPWVGAAMAVGSLLELWADGGKVGTQAKEPASDAEAHAMFSRAFNDGSVSDLRGGGKVPGDWAENKDTVPALLVEEEFVLPAEAAALVGERDLERLRGYGLKLRARGETPDTIRPVGLAKASRLFGVSNGGAGSFDHKKAL